MGSTGECQQGRPHTLTHVGGLTHSRSYCYCSRRQTAQEAPTLSFKTVVFSERVRAPCALPVPGASARRCDHADHASAGASSLLDFSCTDDVDWDNGSGKRCIDYREQQWCHKGAFVVGKEWTGGSQFNYPERHCCVCGRQGGGTSATPAPSIGTTSSASAPSPVGADAPMPPRAVTSGAYEVTKTNAELLAEVPPEERDVLSARLSECSAQHANPLPAARTLLLFTRLPRAGNALACQMMSSCSGQQSRSACGKELTYADVAASRAGCPVAPAANGPAANGVRFAFYGSEKLPSSGYACASGLNASHRPECLSFGGDHAAVCNYLVGAKAPGALMLTSERYPDLAVPPCISVRPNLRLLALLRDPGERAQSAWTFHLQNCVCNFQYQWCTMFTSFRFRQRQTHLCEDHTPKHGFASAIAVLHKHGNMPWPTASSEATHVLGRYTASIVKEVYAPYFGGYKPAARRAMEVVGHPQAHDARQMLRVGGHRRGHAALALLLKQELPAFFGRMDTSQYTWRPSSGPGASSDPIIVANESRHPFLRSGVLPKDYAIYDGEKQRLARGRKAGLVSASGMLVVPGGTGGASAGGTTGGAAAPPTAADAARVSQGASLLTGLKASVFD